MAIESFLNFLRHERRYSPHTVTSYENDLSQLSSFLVESYSLEDLDRVEHRHVRSWIVSLIEQDISPRSVNRKIATLRSFYKFMLGRELITHDPMRKVKALKSSKRLPSFVKEPEMLHMLNDFSFAEDFEGQRDRIILEFLYATGMRLSELLQLQDSDIDQSKGQIKVLGKRNKERIIPVPDALLALARDYVNLKRSTFSENCAGQLIVTNTGKAAYPMLVYRTVKKYLSTLTSTDKQSPHTLRHTFATHLLDKGADLNAVKDLLGHSSLAATQVYTHNSLEKLKSAFERAHPKA